MKRLGFLYGLWIFRSVKIIDVSASHCETVLYVVEVNSLAFKKFPLDLLISLTLRSYSTLRPLAL